MSSAQTTTNSPRLAINIATLITTEEQCHAGNLIRNGTTLRRVQLANLALGATLPRTVKDGLRHARLDEAGADGVDADTRAGQLVRDSLGNGYDRSLGGGVIGRTGVGADTSNGSSEDDGTAGIRLGLGGYFHRWRSVLCGEEDTIVK